MEKNKSTTGTRIWAVLIDFLIIAALNSAVYMILNTFNVGLEVILPIIILICILYPVVFELTHMSATPGMRILGLYVIFDGRKHHAISVLKRSFLRIFLCLPLGFGFWYAFFEKRGKSLYDYVSGASVVRVRKRSKGGGLPCVYRRHGDGTYKAYAMDSDSLVLGRNPRACQIVFPPDEAGVSRCHCSITYNKQTDMFLLEDLCSSYGTFLENGTKLATGKTVALNPNEKFYVGKIENEFVVGFAQSV